MIIDNVIKNAQKYFPNLEIKYKDNTWWMKLLSFILFFNKQFLTDYTNVVGTTIYFPTKSYLKTRPVSASIVILHELVHFHDMKKLGSFLFSFLYLTPQIFVFLLFPLLFISWKIALFTLIFLLPIPSYFRMYYEKRAYLASLYILDSIGKKLHFDSNLEFNKQFFLDQFAGPYYYFMWPFGNLKEEFNLTLNKIQSGQKPFEDPVFDMLDDLLNQI